ncbi:hypothetical protein CH063_07145, partial [Colletotrichum higginsianum]
MAPFVILCPHSLDRQAPQQPQPQNTRSLLSFLYNSSFSSSMAAAAALPALPIPSSPFFTIELRTSYTTCVG